MSNVDGSQPMTPPQAYALALCQKRRAALEAAARFFQDLNWPLGELLSRLVVLVPPVFQFHASTAACITVDECTSATDDFATSPALILAALGDAHHSVMVEVCYLDQDSTGKEKSFLPEEYDFVSSLANMLLAYLARRDAIHADRVQVKA